MRCSDVRPTNFGMRGRTVSVSAPTSPASIVSLPSGEAPAQLAAVVHRGRPQHLLGVAVVAHGGAVARLEAPRLDRRHDLDRPRLERQHLEVGDRARGERPARARQRDELERPDPGGRAVVARRRDVDAQLELGVAAAGAERDEERGGRRDDRPVLGQAEHGEVVVVDDLALVADGRAERQHRAGVDRRHAGRADDGIDGREDERRVAGRRRALGDPDELVREVRARRRRRRCSITCAPAVGPTPCSAGAVPTPGAAPTGGADPASADPARRLHRQPHGLGQIARVGASLASRAPPLRERRMRRAARGRPHRRSAVAARPSRRRSSRSAPSCSPSPSIVVASSSSSASPGTAGIIDVGAHARYSPHCSQKSRPGSFRFPQLRQTTPSLTDRLRWAPAAARADRRTAGAARAA